MGIQHDEYIKKLGIKNFHDYKKSCSPFFHCSKKPAIGYQYLQENLGEFQKANFRLFGLQGDYIFPLYFVRKAKESLCPIKAQSETNESTTSYSRIPKMATLIENIQLAEQIAEQTEQALQLYEYNDNYGIIQGSSRSYRYHEIKQFRDPGDKQPTRAIFYKFHRDYLGFTNHETKVKYIYCGDNYEMYSTTTYELLGTETLENVHKLILYYYEKVKRNILLPLMAKSEISTHKKEAIINDYGGIDKFNETKELCLANLNRNIAERQRKYKLTKTLE